MPSTPLSLTPHGPQVSRIVPGVMRLLEWKLSPPELLGWIKQCLDLGVTTFDHADIYGPYQCEEAFGAALALEPSRRDQMQIISKCGIKLLSDRRPQHALKSYDTSHAHIIASVENSLKMLRTDHLDVLLIHRPDPLLDADEVAAAFNTLREAGKVLHFGVSNFLPSHFDLLQSRLDAPLVTNQLEFSVMHLDPIDDGTLNQAQARRAAPMAWSPLGGGRLFDPHNERAGRVRAALHQVGREHGLLDGDARLEQIAIAWLLAHPARVVPVLGTGNIARIQRAVEAEAIQLTREQWFMVWSASAGRDVA
jgi:predicted oxidoreductase